MKKATRIFTFIFVLSLVLSALPAVFAAAPVISLPKIYADRMVLQRNEEVSIYGFCSVDDSTVKVSVNGQTKSTVSENGSWLVKLDPMTAAKNLTLTVSVTGGNTITIKDVAIGEVWLCSGQSNMDMELSDIEDYESFYEATVGTKDIRSFSPGHSGYISPLNTSATLNQTTGAWYKSNSDNFASSYVSAIGYVAAYEMLKYFDEDIAIGLLDLNCGDTSIEKWIPAEVLSKRDIYADALATYNKAVEDVANGHLDTLTEPGEKYKYWKTVPASFYNYMIAPYMPYTVKGCFWYQGCNNYANYDQYVSYFSDMIDAWRTGFGNKNMPFITFQLAPYADKDHRGMREAQFEAAEKLDNVYLVSTATDGYTYSEREIEDGSGRIHPWEKSPIAKRAAHTALKCVYNNDGMGSEYSHPIPKEFAVNGNKAILTFSHIGTGLKIDTTTFSELKGFEVSADGETFYDAEATIDKNKTDVILKSDSVADINYIRYGYNGGGNVIEYEDGAVVNGVYDTLNKPVTRSTLGGNLTNSVGYPTPAFRLDASYKSDISVGFYGKSAPKGDNKIGVGDDVISIGGQLYKNYGLRVNALDYNDGNAGNSIEDNGLTLDGVTTSDYVVDFAESSGKADTENHGNVASRSWAKSTKKDYVLHCYNASASIPGATGDVAVISFDMYFEKMYGDTSFGFKRYFTADDGTTKNEWPTPNTLANIGFTNQTIYAGASKQFTKPFPEEEWHTITMIFDFEAQKYSVALDGVVFAADVDSPLQDGRTLGLYCWHYDPADTNADTSKKVYVDNVYGYRYKKLSQADYEADLGEVTQTIGKKYDTVTVCVNPSEKFSKNNIWAVAALYADNKIENIKFSDTAIFAGTPTSIKLTGIDKTKNHRLKLFFIDKSDPLSPAFRAFASED